MQKATHSNNNSMKYRLNKKTTTILLILCSMACLPTTVFAAKIQASVDRNPVSINESFQLIFSSSESPDDDPDFSPLHTDFEILGQSQRSNSSWVNGQSSRTIEWVLNVMATRTGRLQIPAISFGNDQSQPISILITSAQKNTQQGQYDDLFIEVEVKPKKAYVQSQILYTMRLYRNVQLTQARLTEPELDDALIEKLGDDKNYNTLINGIRYEVIERNFAVFPQKSGSSRIEPLILTAQVVENGRQRFNSFFSSPMVQTKRITSEAIDIEVLPAPDDIKSNHWLPSEQVFIEENWSGDKQQMKVGEPMTRTITLLAKGTTVAQLPELHQDMDIDALKSYPDQPLLQEQKKTDGIIAFREEKIAYIPSKPGAYTLPAIVIPWFNTLTGTMETALIPETQLQIMPSANPLNTTPQIPTDSETELIKPERTIETHALHTSPIWQWLSLFLFIGWLATLFYFLRKPKKTEVKEKQHPESIKIKQSIAFVRQACKEGNANAVKDALIEWGTIQWQQKNLPAIARLTNHELELEIMRLNQYLYAKEETQWNAIALLNCFNAFQNQLFNESPTHQDNQLEPIFKLASG